MKNIRNIKKVVVIAFMAAVMYALTACGTTTIDLNKYIEIESAGYDSYGTVKYEFDDEAFIKDYGDKIKITTKDKELLDYIGAGENTNPYSLLRWKCVGYRMDKLSGISNGDTLTLHWNCNDELAQDAFNCQLKYKDIEYTVSNLKDVEKFDPFEHVEVSFQGISPDGTVTVTPEYDVKEMQYIKITTDKDSGLREGDTITLKATLQGEETEFVESFGCFPSVSEKEYTVKGLATYVTSVKDIPQDVNENMRKHGEDIFRSYVASDWSEKVLMKGVSCVGNYFLTRKDGMRADYNNYIYYVYRVGAETGDSAFDFYYFVSYTDILLLPDGTCTVDFSSYGTPGGWRDGMGFRKDGYYFEGAEKLESMFNKCVVRKIDQYEYEDTVVE